MQYRYHHRALARALKICGSYREMARRSVRYSYSTWRRLHALPYEPALSHALALEKATGGKVDRLEMMPAMLAGPLGRRLVKLAVIHDAELHRELAERRLAK